MIRPDSYVGHLVAGRDPAEVGDIDDWIERWHEGDSGLELHEFLGMTSEEYGNWVLAPACLGHIVATRRLVEEGRVAFQAGVARASGNIN